MIMRQPRQFYCSLKIAYFCLKNFLFLSIVKNSKNQKVKFEQLTSLKITCTTKNFQKKVLGSLDEYH